MNYFEHHIGDYASATSHLTLVEDAIYSRLLRRYYLDERPLPADAAQCARLAGARTQDERDAADAVLAEFFPVGEDGMRHNKRADAEIEAYRHKVAAAVANGKKGGRPKSEPKAEETQPFPLGLQNETEPKAEETQPFPLGLQNETEPKALQAPSSKEEQKQKQEQVTYGHSSPAAASPPPDDPLGLNGRPEKPPAETLDAGMPPCPHEAIISAYHAALPTLPRVRAWTPQRAKLLRSRWRESRERQEVGWWAEFFAYVAASDFLMGRTSRGNGHGGWECSLPWLLKAENFAKVIEGHYENRAAA